MLNYHIIEVKYLGPTNSLGSRVKIVSARFNQSVVISYNHSFNSTKDIAINWLESKGFNILGCGEGKDSYLLISSTFEPLR